MSSSGGELPDRWGQWTDGGVFTVLALNIGTGAAILIVFSVLRRMERHRGVYEPREAGLHPNLFRPAIDTTPVPPPPPPRGALGFLTGPLATTDEQVLHHCGLDAALYLVFIKAMMKLVLFVAVVTSVVLVPVNSIGGANEERIAREREKDGSAEVYFSGFSDWLAINVEDGSPLLWVHLVVFFLVSTGLYVFLARFTLAFYTLRKKYYLLRRRDMNVQSHTVLVRGIPLAVKTPRPVAEAFERIYPGEVAVVHLVMDMPELLDCRERRLKLKRERATLLNRYRYDREMESTGRMKHGKHAKRPKVRRQPYKLCLSESVDHIAHLDRQIDKLDRAIEWECSRTDHTPTGAAFVTFRSPLTARKCVQNFAHRFDVMSVRATDPEDAKPSRLDEILFRLGIKYPPPEGFVQGIWTVQPAPSPLFVVWKNLSIPPHEATIRWTILAAVTAALVVAWALPVAFLGSLERLSTVPGIGPAFQHLLELPPTFVSFLTAYLPVLVLVGFNAALPFILTLITTNEGAVDVPTLRTRIMIKFFTFMLFSVIVVPSLVIGSVSALSQLTQKIGDDPLGSILLLLTEVTTPKTGTFIAYTTQLALTTTTLQLLQIPRLAIGYFKSKIARSDKDRRDAYKPTEFLYHLQYPILLLVTAINFFFCVSMPITTPFALIFFACKYAVDKYNLLYVHETSPSTKGMLPGAVLRLILVIQWWMQIGAAGLFLSKRAYVPFGIAVTLFFVTVAMFRRVDFLIERVQMEDYFVSRDAPPKPGIAETGEDYESAAPAEDNPFDTPIKPPKKTNKEQGGSDEDGALLRAGSSLTSMSSMSSMSSASFASSASASASASASDELDSDDRSASTVSSGSKSSSGSTSQSSSGSSSSSGSLSSRPPLSPTLSSAPMTPADLTTPQHTPRSSHRRGHLSVRPLVPSTATTADHPDPNADFSSGNGGDIGAGVGAGIGGGGAGGDFRDWENFCAAYIHPGLKPDWVHRKDWEDLSDSDSPLAAEAAAASASASASVPGMDGDDDAITTGRHAYGKGDAPTRSEPKLTGKDGKAKKSRKSKSKSKKDKKKTKEEAKREAKEAKEAKRAIEAQEKKARKEAAGKKRGKRDTLDSSDSDNDHNDPFHGLVLRLQKAGNATNNAFKWVTHRTGKLLRFNKRKRGDGKFKNASGQFEIPKYIQYRTTFRRPALFSDKLILEEAKEFVGVDEGAVEALKEVGIGVTADGKITESKKRRIRAGSSSSSSSSSSDSDYSDSGSSSDSDSSTGSSSTSNSSGSSSSSSSSSSSATSKSASSSSTTSSQNKNIPPPPLVAQESATLIAEADGKK